MSHSKTQPVVTSADVTVHIPPRSVLADVPVSLENTTAAMGGCERIRADGQAIPEVGTPEASGPEVGSEVQNPPGGRLNGRIALITGASRGVGAAVAKRFAAEGARVVLVARTVGGLEAVDDHIQAAGGTPATLVPLDLTDPTGIDALAQALQQRFGQLDILVAAAGVVGVVGPVALSDPKYWERALVLNLMANYRLIRVLDPLLRRAEAGRALFVTCAAARAGEAYWGAYAASKAALEATVRAYAAETLQTRLRVNLIDPGPVRTALREKAFPGLAPETWPLPESVTDAFVALAESGCKHHGTLATVGG